MIFTIRPSILTIIWFDQWISSSWFKALRRLWAMWVRLFNQSKKGILLRIRPISVRNFQSSNIDNHFPVNLSPDLLNHKHKIETDHNYDKSTRKDDSKIFQQSHLIFFIIYTIYSLVNYDGNYTKQNKNITHNYNIFYECIVWQFRENWCRIKIKCHHSQHQCKAYIYLCTNFINPKDSKRC